MVLVVSHRWAIGWVSCSRGGRTSVMAYVLRSDVAVECDHEVVGGELVREVGVDGGVVAGALAGSVAAHAEPAHAAGGDPLLVERHQREPGHRALTGLGHVLLAAGHEPHDRAVTPGQLVELHRGRDPGLLAVAATSLVPRDVAELREAHEVGPRRGDGGDLLRATADGADPPVVLGPALLVVAVGLDVAVLVPALHAPGDLVVELFERCASGEADQYRKVAHGLCPSCEVGVRSWCEVRVVRAAVAVTIRACRALGSSANRRDVERGSSCRKLRW